MVLPVAYQGCRGALPPGGTPRRPRAGLPRARTLLLIVLFLGGPVLPGAQDTGPAAPLNRETLGRILRDRGIPFRDTGSSLLVRPDSSPEEGPSGLPDWAFILAVPLGRAGEEGEAVRPAGELPLPVSAALAFIEKAGAPAPGGPEGIPPALAIIFLEGDGEAPGTGKPAGAGETPVPAGEAAGEPPLLPEDLSEEPEYSVLWYLDMTGAGALEFGLSAGRSPSLGSLLPLPELCETLNIPWSFEGPLLAGRRLPYLAQAGGDRGRPDLGVGRNTLVVRSKAGGRREGESLKGEVLGELLYRYSQSRPGDQHREHNYLIIQAGGRTLFIAELPLVLMVLGTCSCFLCGVIFIPRFPFKPALPDHGLPGGRKGPIGSEILLWICLLGTLGMALFRISLYPLWALALIPAFAARSIHRTLPRRLCLGGLGLYLAFLLAVTFR